MAAQEPSQQSPQRHAAALLERTVCVAYLVSHCQGARQMVDCNKTFASNVAGCHAMPCHDISCGIDVVYSVVACNTLLQYM